MTRTIVSRTIDAPAERVFRAVSDVEQLPDVVPNIVGIELLPGPASGLGMRFRETRRVGKREDVTELEVTEYEPHGRVRMVADSHGTVWDSVFVVREEGGRTELELTMDARAHKLLPKIMNPLIKGLVKKGLEQHVEAVKTYCER